MNRGCFSHDEITGLKPALDDAREHHTTEWTFTDRESTLGVQHGVSNMGHLEVPEIGTCACSTHHCQKFLRQYDHMLDPMRKVSAKSDRALPISV